MNGIVSDILTTVGLAPEILSAISKAELDPTSANINAVIGAYARNGQTPPPQLMAQLIDANRTRHPEDPYIENTLGSIAPWLLLGIAAFVILRR